MNIPEVAHEHKFKVPVVKTKDYVISFEEHETQGTFIHCDVYGWSKSVFMALQIDFARLCRLHGGPIHALHDSNDRKHEKFLKLFGFAKAKDLGDQELWIWSK
jgi:hypothetical protein